MKLKPIADIRVGKTFITQATGAWGAVLKKYPHGIGNARTEEVLVSLVYPNGSGAKMVIHRDVMVEPEDEDFDFKDETEE